MNLAHPGQDYQRKREVWQIAAIETGIPCNLLLFNDSDIEGRHGCDHVLLTLHTPNISVLHVAQTSAVGAGAMLITDRLPNITNILDPSLSLHRYLSTLQAQTSQRVQLWETGFSPKDGLSSTSLYHLLKTSCTCLFAQAPKTDIPETSSIRPFPCMLITN